ncbi:uncharacterized protein LOC115094525 [Rhinatrema bivittatum]|uniref:uncharacterized protein LOC115094525 n=1 Tax=Rhinatrema bivittatum TaxID=194408 RepID=UPI00112BA7A9|nr:uncharacterized protein LOC115094525 [Rhinatrema bivittatum]
MFFGGGGGSNQHCQFQRGGPLRCLYLVEELGSEASPHSCAAGMWPLLLLCLSMAVAYPEVALLHQGQAQLRRVEDYARHPRYGRCWAQALRRVTAGCRQLSEEEQGKIALSFTHCHLQRSGRSFPECKDGSSVRQCTQDMDPVAFGAYTEFFTHTHSICYFLQSEVWQQEAEDTMSRLTVNSDNVARQLEATNRMAEDTIKVQNAVLLSQEEILHNGEFLKKSLQDSTDGVKQAFQDMQQATGEQRLLFTEIFNRVAYLQQFVVGESSMLYSFLYSLLASIAAFLLTSTKRTAGARLILFGLVAVNIYVERSIATSILGSSESSYEAEERISFWVSLVRRASAGLGLCVLFGFIVCHRDVGRESLKMLQSLQARQEELQRILRETEKILSKADLAPPSDAFSSKVHAMFVDSGMKEKLGSQEFSAEPQDSNPVVKSHITPKKRSKMPSCHRVEPVTGNGRESPSHHKSRHKVEPAVFSVPESASHHRSSHRGEPAPYIVPESPSRRRSSCKVEPAAYNVPESPSRRRSSCKVEPAAYNVIESPSRRRSSCKVEPAAYNVPGSPSCCRSSCKVEPAAYNVPESPSRRRNSCKVEPAAYNVTESPSRRRSSCKVEPAAYNVPGSPSRCKSRHKAEPAVYSIPVSLESTPRYSLRSRKSVAGFIRE